MTDITASKVWEIWVGKRNDAASDKPMLMANVEAKSFSTACLIWELACQLQAISNTEKDEEMPDGMDATQFQWLYNAYDNSNIHLGKYYPTSEETEKSFHD